jgi:hypothetical protein
MNFELRIAEFELNRKTMRETEIMKDQMIADFGLRSSD